MAESVFSKKVYQIVAQIPKGKVVSYGQIAFMLGIFYGGGKAVGNAMRNAPEGQGLPCHRVVRTSGKLSPGHVFGGTLQKDLLEAEGITFLPNGNVDMKKHAWIKN